MASATPTGRGGKRNYDMEINLVPFIDLLSCCIAFLMIVAVWTQIARIDVTPNTNGPAAEVVPKDDPLKLTIALTANGYVLSDASGASLVIPRVGKDYNDHDLDDKLKAVRSKFSDETKVNVTSDDGIAYKHLIAVMDTCLKNGFTGISVGGN